MSKNNKPSNWKVKLHEIIYEADTPLGKIFDVVLLILILTSIIAVMLESIEEIDNKYHKLLNISEWIITILFTLEYIARIISVKKPKEYIFSFYGIVDLLSTLPKYLSLFFVGTHVLVALRAIRLLRIFRILKLARLLGASTTLTKALKASRAKISVFLFAVVILCVILGTVMYLIEGQSDSGFTSIPMSIYWTIVTLTTVGYGDIAPVTPLGQLIASIIMIVGYGIIAIPTGIVGAQYAIQGNLKDINLNTQSCPNCALSKHKDNAIYCYGCGEKMND
jgi:voltage-gated potassium channel